MTLRIAVTFPLSLGVPGGGTEDCLNLARHMRREGADITVLSTMSSGPGAYPRKAPSKDAFEAAATDLAQEGIKTIAVPIHPAHYLLDGRPMRRAMLKLLNTQRVDAVLAWWHEAAFLPSLLEQRGITFGIIAAASYALVFPSKDRWRRPFQAFRGRYLVRAPLRRAAVVFARSAFTQGEITEFASVPEERVRLVPCGIDARFASVKRMEVEGPPRLLFFGRFLPEKGIFDAIAALGRLVRGGQKDWRLRVAGWGDMQAVQSKARAHGVLDRLDFLGPLARPALIDELARAELVVLPSYSESFGLANAEAQAASVPVVAYRAGAVPEVVVDGETGWLVPTGDVVGLAEAIGKALADPEERRRRGLAGRERVQREFTWERAAKATLEGLRDVLPKQDQ